LIIGRCVSCGWPYRFAWFQGLMIGCDPHVSQLNVTLRLRTGRPHREGFRTVVGGGEVPGSGDCGGGQPRAQASVGLRDVCEVVDDVVAGVGDAEGDRVRRRDAVLFGARAPVGLSPSDGAVESAMAGASIALDA
jgi:hypothetical protein